MHANSKMKHSRYLNVYNCIFEEHRVFFNWVCMHIHARDEAPSLSFCFMIWYSPYFDIEIFVHLACVSSQNTLTQLLKAWLSVSKTNYDINFDATMIYLRINLHSATQSQSKLIFMQWIYLQGWIISNKQIVEHAAYLKCSKYCNKRFADYKTK